MRSVLVVALIFSYCKEPTLHLTKNNTTAANALAVKNDQKTYGTFTSSENEFFVRIQLSTPAMFRAELSPAKDADTSLSLFSPQTTLLFTADDKEIGGEEAIAPVYLSAGESVVRITNKSSNKSDFSFFYRTFSPPSAVEREPNNDFTTATRMLENRATGFYGPLFFQKDGVREKEQDCFLKELTDDSENLVSIRLSGVVGVLGSLTLFGAGKELLLTQVASQTGKAIATSPQYIEEKKFYVCVKAESTQSTYSKDYYDLVLTTSTASEKIEREPNNTPENANNIRSERIEGSIGIYGDIDFFSYQNKFEYPILLSITLESGMEKSLSLNQYFSPKKSLVFEDSDTKGEIIENIHIDSGESVKVFIKQRKKIQKKNFKAIKYTLAFKETPSTDENEVEPNSTPKDADTWVDLTQKWGLINPLRDIDFYRITMEKNAERIITLETHIDCEKKLELWRTNKKLHTVINRNKIELRTNLQNDDIVSVSCMAQKPNPKERSYRLTLSEP
ncbi:MAG: hypothetical protein LDLANPLL_00384 [Turneriella sp.]|nr:hypothetical protein [Turneriella sp.]